MYNVAIDLQQNLAKLECIGTKDSFRLSRVFKLNFVLFCSTISNFMPNTRQNNSTWQQPFGRSRLLPKPPNEKLYVLEKATQGSISVILLTLKPPKTVRNTLIEEAVKLRRVLNFSQTRLSHHEVVIHSYINCTPTSHARGDQRPPILEKRGLSLHFALSILILRRSQLTKGVRVKRIIYDFSGHKVR